MAEQFVEVLVVAVVCHEFIVRARICECDFREP